MSKQRKFIISVLYFFFLLSGMTGLIYEILWSRQLSIIFGHTVFAVSSILSAFMGGLALGSYLAGKIIDDLDNENPKNPIIRFFRKKSKIPHVMIYGILELFIGLYALITPFLTKITGDTYISIMRNFSLSLYPVSIITFILSAIVFIIPAMCMGATLPVILKFVVKTWGELMEKTARFYAVNTFGAVLGAFLAGFVLFPILGLKVTLLTAAAVNLAIGLITLIIERRWVPESGDNPAETAEEPDTAEKVSKNPAKDNSGLFKTVLIVFFISGFTSMVYEVGWSRALALAIGSSTYSFSTILVTFLFGIALGSLIFSKVNIKGLKEKAPLMLGDLELAIGIMGFIIIPALGALPYLFLKMFPYLKESYVMIMGGNFILSFLIILLPTILYGISFPLVVRIYTSNLESLGKSIGTVYASNTAGNILGSFLAGFLLIPVLGAENTLKLAVFLNVFAAFLIYVKTANKSKTKLFTFVRYALIIAVILGIFTVNSWEESAMTLGTSVYADDYSKRVVNWKEFRKMAKETGRLIVFYKDGISSTVTILKAGDRTVLRVNGKADASYSPGGSLDMYTQWLLGFIPMVSHPSPERVCVIGFGSGITAGAVDQFDEVKVIDSIEIEPAVMLAARYFDAANFNVMSSPKFKNHIADGRNFIIAADKKYDVIISEPSNPWIAGIGNLFSTDFFKIAKKRLNDDGIYCQWVQAYGLTPETFKMVVNSFYSVFPDGSVWITQRGDLMLIGRKKPGKLDYKRLSSIMKNNGNIKEYMGKIGYMEPYQLTANFITGADRARAYARGARLNSDDKPLLEFDAPMNLYTKTERMEIIRDLMKYRKGYEEEFTNFEKPDDEAEFYLNKGKTYMNLGLWTNAEDSFGKALKIKPDLTEAAVKSAESSQLRDEPLKGALTLQDYIRTNPGDLQAYTALINLYKRFGMTKEIVDLCQRGLETVPESPLLLRELTIALISKNSFREALTPSKKLATLEPDNYINLLYLARIYLETENTKKAVEIYEWLNNVQPQNPAALEGLGDAARKSKEYDRAADYYGKALTILQGQNKIPILFKFADLNEKRGKKEEAKSLLKLILKIDPLNPGARIKLSELGKNG